MNHSDEQVLLPRVREELDITFSTTVADHCKAGDLRCVPVPIVCIHKSPVHLEAFAGFRGVSPSAVPLGSHHTPPGWDQTSVGADVILDDSLSALIPLFQQPVIDYVGVCHILSEQSIDGVRIACQLGLSGLPATSFVRQELEMILLQAAEPASADPSHSLEFGKVHRFQAKVGTLCFLPFI